MRKNRGSYRHIKIQNWDADLGLGVWIIFQYSETSQLRQFWGEKVGMPTLGPISYAFIIFRFI